MSARKQNLHIDQTHPTQPRPVPPQTSTTLRYEPTALIAAGPAQTMAGTRKNANPFLEELHARAHTTTNVLQKLLQRSDSYWHGGIRE